MPYLEHTVNCAWKCSFSQFVHEPYYHCCTTKCIDYDLDHETSKWDVREDLKEICRISPPLFHNLNITFFSILNQCKMISCKQKESILKIMIIIYTNIIMISQFYPGLYCASSPTRCRCKHASLSLYSATSHREINFQIIAENLGN